MSAKTHNRVSIRVKPGSALERLLNASTSTPGAAIHDMAAALEVIKPK